MSSAAILGARSRAYGLMARMLLRGVDDVAWERLIDLPELWAGLGELPDRDELAAQHHASFHLGVFPYAGVFLTHEAEAGAFSDRVRHHYARAGFSPRLDEVGADHLGVILAFLSFSTGAQADAVEDDRPAIAARLDRLAGEFLEECVLSWLPSLHTAMDGHGSRFWADVVAMALALAVDHRARMRQPYRAVELPPVESPLDDERAGLRAIAEFLLTPAHAGVFLTRRDIAQLGRTHDVPRGFGGRELMLTNLLRNAVDLGELPAVLDTLDALLIDRANALEETGRTHGLHGHVAPWQRRIRATRGIVLRLRRHAHALTAEPPDHVEAAPATVVP